MMSARTIKMLSMPCSLRYSFKLVHIINISILWEPSINETFIDTVSKSEARSAEELKTVSIKVEFISRWFPIYSFIGPIRRDFVFIMIQLFRVKNLRITSLLNVQCQQSNGTCSQINRPYSSALILNQPMP